MNQQLCNTYSRLTRHWIKYWLWIYLAKECIKQLNRAALAPSNTSNTFYKYFKYFLQILKYFLFFSDFCLLVCSHLWQCARVWFYAELQTGKWKEDLASSLGIQTPRCWMLYNAGKICLVIIVDFEIGRKLKSSRHQN